MKYPKITTIIREAARRAGYYFDAQLSRAIGMKYSTLQYRFRHPGTWRLYEIGSLLRHVTLEDEEIKKIRGAI